MNARILELIKNPELIQNQDLVLLKSEIDAHPYIQNVRALHLYGVHKFQPEDYSNVLSSTAAYTTDKKILYQFINKSSAPAVEKPRAVTEEIPLVDETPVPPKPETFTQITSVPKPKTKPVYVNGELNRILFEGEEDFLDRKTSTIDIEATQEAGMLVTHDNAEEEIVVEIPVNQDEEKDKVAETYQEELDSIDEEQYPEINIEADAPEAKEEENLEEEEPSFSDEIVENVEDPTEDLPVAEAPETASVNFHGTDQFLPDVKVAVNHQHSTSYEVAPGKPSRHEEEMQRLIAEVEAKMKTAKKKAPVEEEVVSTSLDFFETQEFSVPEPEINAPKIESIVEAQQKDLPEISAQKTSEEKVSDKVESVQQKKSAKEQPKTAWKPMNFSGNTPDALIGIAADAPQKENPSLSVSTPERVVEESAEKPSAEEVGDQPAFNISFFTQQVTSLETKKAEELIEDLKNHVEPAPEEKSNVPVFINTWQNWLKIDRSSEKDSEAAAIAKIEEKNKVIETFITKEPKISKLKEETDFVVKERGDNISHLMTETLANLYAEQKLYTKAIKAYQILTEKYPDRKATYDEKISMIKEQRQNK